MASIRMRCRRAAVPARLIRDGFVAIQRTDSGRRTHNGCPKTWLWVSQVKCAAADRDESRSQLLSTARRCCSSPTNLRARRDVCDDLACLIARRAVDMDRPAKVAQLAPPLYLALDQATPDGRTSRRGLSATQRPGSGCQRQWDTITGPAVSHPGCPPAALASLRG